MDQWGRLEAEREGLLALRVEAGELVVPRPLALETSQGQAVLALEWLDLGPGTSAQWARLGAGLAGLHRRSAGVAFGWGHDTWIGSGRQRGGWHGHWGEFFVRRRLQDQLATLARSGVDLAVDGAQWTLLAHRLVEHAPTPCLVHGDLWSGNAGVLRDGRPTIFDPAVSYSDREVDLAMAHLFGGFPPEFFSGYEAVWPLPDGHPWRRSVYNLYHLLNHAVLFGGNYIGESARTLERVLADC
jgi:fructosamine-3-kinase